MDELTSCPKPERRIVNPDFYKAVHERDGVCLWGMCHHDGCQGPLEAHHIVPRGRGGDDLPENGILLCQKHHQQYHRHEISEEELREVLDYFLRA